MQGGVGEQGGQGGSRWGSKGDAAAAAGQAGFCLLSLRRALLFGAEIQLGRAVLHTRQAARVCIKPASSMLAKR